MLVQFRQQAVRAADRIPHDAAITGLEVAMLAALALASARLVWTIATPVEAFGNWQPVVARSGPDPALLGTFDPFFRASDTDPATAVSTLGLTLLGTRVDMVSGRGSAIIAAEDGKQSSYIVGEEIVPGVTLKSVAFDEVVLDRGGSAESLFLDQSSGSIPVTPDSSGIVASAMSKVRLAADILITPRLRGTTITGFVLTPKSSGAAFSAAGLQPGDVLVSVDGAPVSTISDPASLRQRLDAGGVTAGIERGGQAMTLRIGGNL